MPINFEVSGHNPSIDYDVPSAPQNAEYNVDVQTSNTNYAVSGDPYYTDQAKEYAQQAEEAKNLAEYYASLSVSAVWIKVEVTDWELDGSLYKKSIDGILAVLSVYRGEWNNKELISNIDVTITDLETVLFSPVAFDGYVLASKTILESDDYVPATVDTLAAMLETDIIDITGGEE